MGWRRPCWPAMSWAALEKWFSYDEGFMLDYRPRWRNTQSEADAISVRSTDKPTKTKIFTIGRLSRELAISDTVTVFSLISTPSPINAPPY